MALASLGFEFVGAFLFFGGGGYLLDRYATASGRPGLFLILGLFLGFGGGLWHIVRRTREVEAEDEAAGNPDVASRKSESVRDQVDRLRSEMEAVGERIDAVVSDHELMRRARAAQAEKKSARGGAGGAARDTNDAPDAEP